MRFLFLVALIIVVGMVFSGQSEDLRLWLQDSASTVRDIDFAQEYDVLLEKKGDLLLQIEEKKEELEGKYETGKQKLEETKDAVADLQQALNDINDAIADVQEAAQQVGTIVSGEER